MAKQDNGRSYDERSERHDSISTSHEGILQHIIQDTILQCPCPRPSTGPAFYRPRRKIHSTDTANDDSTSPKTTTFPSSVTVLRI